jgi:hypothetical protein
MNIYIKSCAQISVQEPLCDKWFTEPIRYEAPYVRALDPDYKPFINPVAARRMGLILKRAMATSLSALKDADVEMPDAIITATGLGCIENTEKFLKALSEQGENCLQPTFFINSTHNTIGSYVAVQMKCHGYNNTHVHRGISFESALLDAFVKIKLGKLNNALVGAHDEMTPDYFTLLNRVGFWDGGFAGETAVSMLLAKEGVVKIAGIEVLYMPEKQKIVDAVNRLCLENSISVDDIDLLVTGRNGNKENNKVYDDFENIFNMKDKSESYKDIFGESFTTSAYSVCYAYECLKKGITPSGRKVKNVLLYNQYENKDHSLILLTCH